LVFAGIWQDWGQVEDRLTACAIVTTAALDWMAQTHNREPIRLAPDDWARWLGETGDKAAPLMRPAPEGYYDRWRVDPRVNANRAEGEALILPTEA
jgi:putative SOS response-associated peptidase YedK